MGIVSRGFSGRGRGDDSGRLPPGQYSTDDFPVLSAGPTPHTALAEWSFTIEGGTQPVSWSWEEFHALPSEAVTKDIHCVTKWSKFDTDWEGVAVDTLLESVEHDRAYAVAYCDGGYTTNVPVEDLSCWQAWGAFGYDGDPPAPHTRGAVPSRGRRPALGALSAPFLLKECDMGARGAASRRRGKRRVGGVPTA